jgi:hypothetical protein
MDVAGDHSDGPLLRTRDLHTPQFAWKILEEELCHPVVGLPGGQYVMVEIA